MRWLAILLGLIFLGLQWRLWVGDGSLAEVWHLKRSVAEQQSENESLLERNQALEAEVKDLKQGLDAIEERARTELGMIREDEIFYQIVDDQPSARDDD